MRITTRKPLFALKELQKVQVKELQKELQKVVARTFATTFTAYVFRKAAAKSIVNRPMSLQKIMDPLLDICFAFNELQDKLDRRPVDLETMQLTAKDVSRLSYTFDADLWRSDAKREVGFNRVQDKRSLYEAFGDHFRGCIPYAPGFSTPLGWRVVPSKDCISLQAVSKYGDNTRPMRICIEYRMKTSGKCFSASVEYD
jgi:hypothetical protein